MKPSVQISLLCISLLLAIATCRAQPTFPHNDGERVRYAATIDTPKGGVSGICMLTCDGRTVKGSIMNEFGISLLDFSYSLHSKKVKLHAVVGLMDKWYIRRVLRRDLRQLMQNLQQGIMTYTDEKYGIVYRLTPVEVKSKKVKK